MSNYAKLEETVRAKGTKAFEEGLGPDSCPYTVNSKNGRKFKRLWLAGYVNAKYDMQDASTANKPTSVLIIAVGDQDAAN